MKILNIGCGTKTSDNPDIVNIDWSVYLRIRTNPVFSTVAPLVLNKERYERLQSLPSKIMVHDLRSGIPFADGTVDAVYHSHFFEHLDRRHVDGFLQEAKRVLKPGGIHRIVVPDWETLCRQYLLHLEQCTYNPTEVSRHDGYVAEMIEQMVRRESYGSSQQQPLRRNLENILMGDARKRGETHQWMYDRINLGHLLREANYINITVQAYNTSKLPEWNTYGLDCDNETGNEYKPGSLYMEACKPDLAHE